MQLCQPLVLIFQLFKIFEQRTSALLSLNLGSVPAIEDMKSCKDEDEYRQLVHCNL